MAFCKNCGQKLEEGKQICKSCETKIVTNNRRLDLEKRISALEEETKMEKFASLRKPTKGQWFFALFCIIFGCIAAPLLPLDYPLDIILPIGFGLGGFIDICLMVIKLIKANEAKIKYAQLAENLEKLKCEMAQIIV